MGGPRVGDDCSGPAGQWRARRVPAALLRALIALLPGMVALAAVLVVVRLLPAPTGQAGALAVLRLALLLMVASAVAYAVDRAARRLMPLVLLLRMSLLFPGRAPSRFRLARRACSTDVAAALNPRVGDDAAAVAERAVGLLAALASHDRHTRGHSQRVQVLAEMLAREVGVSRTDRQRLRWAALLHDVGKLSVAASVLSKPGGLADDEWAAMRRHPDEGARLCGPLLDWLGEPGLAIAQHHERYDGTGYPLGLSATAISEAGRLVSLVDAYETMTAARPYKRPMAARDARIELARCAGGHFDPAMVRAFLAIPLPRLMWASGPLSFVVQLPFLPIIQAGTRTAQAVLAAAGTGLVVGGVAAVIATVSAVGPAADAVSAGSASAPGSAAAGSGGTGNGSSTPTGGTTGAGASPGGSTAPSTTATNPGVTGGSGSGGGSTPAPTSSGLLPPLTAPPLTAPTLTAPTLPGGIASALPSTLSSVVGVLVPTASPTPTADASTSTGSVLDLPLVG